MHLDRPSSESRWADSPRVATGWRPAEALAAHAPAAGGADPLDGLDALVRVLDATVVALLLFDGRGRRLRATAAVERLLAEDDGADAVLDAAAALARDCLAATRSAGRGLPPARRVAHTRHWSYRLVAGPTAAAVAVVIERDARRALDDAALRARYGLSPREAEVARLVADGRSTPGAAAALGISPHTARHHLERVFTKLGVTTRGALQALVRGTAADRPPPPNGPSPAGDPGRPS